MYRVDDLSDISLAYRGFNSIFVYLQNSLCCPDQTGLSGDSRTEKSSNAGFLQVLAYQAFGEPAIDLRQQGWASALFALLLPQGLRSAPARNPETSHSAGAQSPGP